LLSKQPIPSNQPSIPIRWIVSDLDGTLLDSSQRIPPGLVRRIARFTESGGRFTFATGRTLRAAMPFISLLQVTSPVILFNGARIYDPALGTYLTEHYLDPAAVRHVMRMYDESNAAAQLDLLLFHQESIFSTALSEQIRKQMHKDGVIIETASPLWMESIYGKVTKLMLLGPEAEIINFQKAAAAAAFPLNTVQSEPQLLEVLPSGINKSIALSAMIRLLGAEADGFAAVGDNLNDLEMIGSVRNGFAVANANPVVKAAAAHVLARSNEKSALLDVIDYAESTWPSDLRWSDAE
jgi:Cof subfamily protein (haloacid dehalogenase superfamily)